MVHIHICRRCGQGQVGLSECRYCLVGARDASMRSGYRILILTLGLLLLGVDVSLKEAEIDRHDLTESVFTQAAKGRTTSIDPVTGERLPENP